MYKRQIVPHSKAIEALDAVTAVYEKYADAKEKHGIRNGFLLVTVGNYGFLIEPVWFWPDARLKMYETAIRPEHLDKLQTYDADEEGRAIVKNMRDELAPVSYTHLRAHETASYLVCGLLLEKRGSWCERGEE